MRSTWKKIALAGAMLLASCANNVADTGVLVHVWLDEGMLRRGDQMIVAYREITFRGDEVVLGDPEAAFGPRDVETLPNPVELAFVAREGREEQGVVVTAAILRGEDVLVMQQHAFVYDPGRWAFKEMSLHRACIDESCGDGKTCSYGSCTDFVLFAEDLPTPEEALQ